MSSDDEKIGDLLREANERLSTLRLFREESYNLTGHEQQYLVASETLMRTLKLLAPKDESLQDIVIELEVLIERIYQKIAKQGKKRNQTLLLLTVAYFASVLIVGVSITFLRLLVSFEDMQTWLAGAVGLIGLVLGAIAFGFWGAIGGGIIGGLLGYAMVFLLTNPIGNILFVLIWLAIFGLVYQKKLVSKFK